MSKEMKYNTIFMDDTYNMEGHFLEDTSPTDRSPRGQQPYGQQLDWTLARGILPQRTVTRQDSSPIGQ